MAASASDVRWSELTPQGTLSASQISVRFSSDAVRPVIERAASLNSIASIIRAPPDGPCEMSRTSGSFHIHCRGGSLMTRPVAALATSLLLSSGSLAAAHLYPETVAAWNRYVAATEQRIARELRSPSAGFLALDFAPASAAARRALLAGDVVVESMTTVTERGAG